MPIHHPEKNPKQPWSTAFGSTLTMQVLHNTSFFFGDDYIISNVVSLFDRWMVVSLTPSGKLNVYVGQKRDNGVWL